MWCLQSLDRAIMGILVEPIRLEFGLNDKQLGMITGLAYAVAFSVAVLPVGYLVDRGHRVRLLAGIAVIWSLMTATVGAAQSFVTLLLARMGVGAASSGESPCSLSLIADYFPPRQGPRLLVSRSSVPELARVSRPSSGVLPCRTSAGGRPATSPPLPDW